MLADIKEAVEADDGVKDALAALGGSMDDVALEVEAPTVVQVASPTPAPTTSEAKDESPKAGEVAESGRPGRAQLLANSGRRGIGRFPRKCELRGPCRVTCVVTYGSAYISPGLNWENPAKFRQNLAKI